MRSRTLLAASLFLVWSAWVAAQTPRQDSAPANPAAEAALTKGEAALKAGRFKDALAAFKRASDLQKQRSAAAFYGISRAYRGLHDYKREAEAAIAGINLAVTVPTEQPPLSELSGQLYNQLGMALASQARKPTDPEMEDAVQAFASALQVSDAVPIALFNLGVVLLQQERYEVGRETLEEYLQTGPLTPEAALAKKYLANPQLAREAFGRGVKKLSR